MTLTSTTFSVLSLFNFLINLQFEVIKEPRGFIKIIQIFVAIFAFATCTGFRGRIELKQTCQNTKSYTTGASFQYPFQRTLIIDYHDTATCTKLMPYQIPLDYKASMQYYVVIGVFCFLYCLGVLAYYILLESEQTHSAAPPEKFSAPVIDFVISVIFVIFWFTSAIACAASVTGIKKTTDVSKIIPRIPGCIGKNGSCSPTIEGNYATLDVSALVGFLNVFVWCGNLWFLYKETHWHTPKSQSAATVGGGPPPVSDPAPAAAI